MKSSPNNSIRMINAEKKRQRQREQVNAQDLTQAFRLAVSGTAGSGVAYTRTDILHFDSPFRPQQASNGTGMVPTFTYGFELNQKGEDRESVNALSGFAKVVKWIENGNGYITGVMCDIGVCLMNSDVYDMDYTGFVHLQFTGPVLMTHDYTIGETS